ncbi:MAG: efflux RND transporter periplasmic adaptor subunit [Firmicutes bacterium]|nr:efflux RND transporter periplasmic adaptor subunit [Bacillota bacterium]
MKMSNFRNFKKSRIVFWAFFCFTFLSAVLTILTGCGGKKEEPKTQSTMTLEIPVDVGRATMAPLERKLDVVGSFNAYAEVSVSPLVSGNVKQVMVKMGDRVKKDQVVLNIDPADQLLQIQLDTANLQQELARLGLSSVNQKITDINKVPAVAKAKATMDNAYSNWQRNIRLRKEDLISDKDVEDSEANYLTSKADYRDQLEQVKQKFASIQSRLASLNISRQNLKYTTLKSPIDGFVKEQKVYAGDYMRSGDAAYTLVTAQPLLLNMEIPEKFIRKISLGKEIFVTTDGLPGKSFKGRIIHINPVSNQTTRTITVQAQIENPSFILKPGMFGRITLVTSIDKVVLIPRAALIDQLGVTKVFLIKKEGGKAKAFETKVEKGDRAGDWIEVKGNIKDGDMAAISSIPILANGIEVKIQKEDSSRPPGGTSK